MKKPWSTRIISHSIYAVVRMPHTTGALAQRYKYWAKAPEDSTHLQHGINAVLSYFDMHGGAVASRCKAVTFEVANKYFMITLEETTGQEPPFDVDDDGEIRKYLAERMLKAADFFQEQTLTQAQ